MHDSLHVIALNQPTEVRHTALTRQRGERATLPPLADWLHVRSVDPERIEIFPVSDLGDMPLTTYLTSAFDIDAGALRSSAHRLNLLEGAILLVPQTAVEGEITPGAEATLVASLPAPVPAAAAPLPKAATRPDPAPRAAPQPARMTPALWGAVAAGLILAVIVVLLIAL